MDSFRETNLIPVLGDGTCLFRCISLFCNPELRTCPRADYLPVDKRLRRLEMESALMFRKVVCDSLSNNLHGLERLSATLPYLILEMSSGQFYDDVQHRIDSMENYSEHAGSLEIIALAHVLERQIRVYKLKLNYNTEFSVMECIGVFPPDLYKQNKPRIYLLHRGDQFDERGNYHPGHFDLLIPRNEKPPSSEVATCHESLALPRLNRNREGPVTLTGLICHIHGIDLGILDSRLKSSKPIVSSSMVSDIKVKQKHRKVPKSFSQKSSCIEKQDILDPYSTGGGLSETDKGPGKAQEPIRNATEDVKKGSGDKASKKTRKRKPVRTLKVEECMRHECPGSRCYRIGRDLPLTEAKRETSCSDVPEIAKGPCQQIVNEREKEKEKEYQCITEGDASEKDIFPPVDFLEAIAPCSDPPYCAPVQGFIKGLRETNSDRLRMERQEQERQKVEKINTKNKENQNDSSKALNKCMLEIEMAACGAKNVCNQTPYVKYLVEKKFYDVKLGCCKATINDMKNQIKLNKRRIASLKKQRGILEIQIEKDTDFYLKEKRFGRVYLTCLFEGAECQLKELNALKEEKKELKKKESEWKNVFKDCQNYLTPSITNFQKITLLDEFPCVLDSIKEAVVALEEGKKEKSLCTLGVAYNLNGECPHDLKDLLAKLEDGGRKLFMYITSIKKLICDPEYRVKGIPESTGDLKMSIRTPIISLDNFMKDACKTAHLSCNDVKDFQNSFNIMENLTVGQILRNSNFLKCISTINNALADDFCKPC